MKKRKHPWMVIIAGPNGAGKSTFYDLVIKDDPLMKNAPFINMDNIAKEISEPDENPNDNMLSAGKIRKKSKTTTTTRPKRVNWLSSGTARSAWQTCASRAAWP